VLASQLASVAIGNAIVLGGAGGATIDTGAGALALNGVISGPGGLTKAGAGTLTLGAPATYAGNTQIVAGSLATGANNALNPLTSVTVNSGASLNLRGHLLTLASVGGSGTITAGNGAASLRLGGTGASFAFNGLLTDGPGQLALTKQGAGTLTLGSANSFSGGVTILGGSLVVGNASALGSGPILMDDGTTLAFLLPSMTVANPIIFTGVADPTIDTGAGSITFTSPITGAGALTKIGSGSLILTGASTYTGATAVAQGTLEVDGSIISPTTIYSGATLRGVGAVGSIDVLSGAVLAPGNAAQPFGTLVANGSVIFAPGSSFSVSLSPTGASQLVVAGAATLGGTVVANWSGGNPTLGATYKILSATGGVTSAFYGLSVNGLTTLLPVLAYDANDVYLAFNGLTKQAVQSSFRPWPTAVSARS
jgi:autotransporter-associated beta strand protein